MTVDEEEGGSFHEPTMPGQVVVGVPDLGALWGTLEIGEGELPTKNPHVWNGPIRGGALGVVLAFDEKTCYVLLSNGTFWSLSDGGRWNVVG